MTSTTREFYETEAAKIGRDLYGLAGSGTRNKELLQEVVRFTDAGYSSDMAKRDQMRIDASRDKNKSGWLQLTVMAFERPWHFGRDYYIEVLGEEVLVTKQAIHAARVAMGYTFADDPSRCPNCDGKLGAKGYCKTCDIYWGGF